MVCAVEEIEKSTLFLGEGGKCDQNAQKSNITTKCLNTFAAHCSREIDVSCSRDRYDEANKVFILSLAPGIGKTFLVSAEKRPVTVGTYLLLARVGGEGGGGGEST